MMLQDVLCTIKNRLIESGYFNVFYEYCELFQRDGVVQPGYYIGGGQYQPVMDFDVNGTGYIRKRSDVSINEDSNLTQLTGCITDTFINVSYPMRMVVGVPRVKLNDDAYSDDLLFGEIASILDGSYSSTNVTSVDVNIVSYDTDSLSLWSQEVKGIDYQMNFRLSYLAIDFNLVFTLKQSCMAQVCGYGY